MSFACTTLLLTTHFSCIAVSSEKNIFMLKKRKNITSYIFNTQLASMNIDNIQIQLTKALTYNTTKTVTKANVYKLSRFKKKTHIQRNLKNTHTNSVG